MTHTFEAGRLTLPQVTQVGWDFGVWEYDNTGEQVSLVGLFNHDRVAQRVAKLLTEAQDA